MVFDELVSTVAAKVDYEYLYLGRRLHKSRLQKSELRKILGRDYNERKTERVMAEEIGAKRVLNAGRTTFLIDRKVV